MNCRKPLCFVILLTLCTLFNASAKEKLQEVILIEAEIYKHPTAKMATSETNFDDLFAGAVLETSPVLTMNVAGTAAIEIGLHNKDGDDDMLRLNFKSGAFGNKYTIDFQLTHQNEEKISTVVTDVDSTLILTSKLNGTLKIAKIKTRKFSNLAQALKAKDN